MLYLPPAVAEQKRREFTHAVMIRCDLGDTRALEYTAKLQQIDPRLLMVKAIEFGDNNGGTPLIPGFYHVLRRNEGAPMTVLAVHENGVYAEPDSRVFDALARGDMTQRRVMTELEKQEKAVEDAVAHEKATQREDRRAELKERVNAAVRAQVSMDRTIPWTQSSNGRRSPRRQTP